MYAQTNLNSANYNAAIECRAFSQVMRYALNLGNLTLLDWDTIGAGIIAMMARPRLWGPGNLRLGLEAIALGAGLPIGANPWGEVWDDYRYGEEMSQDDQDLLKYLGDVYEAAMRRRLAVGW